MYIRAIIILAEYFLLTVLSFSFLLWPTMIIFGFLVMILGFILPFSVLVMLVMVILDGLLIYKLAKWKYENVYLKAAIAYYPLLYTVAMAYFSVLELFDIPFPIA